MVPEARSPFDPSLEEMRSMGDEVLALAVKFIEERYEAPASDYSSLEPLLGSLARPPLSRPQPLAGLLETIEIAAGKGFDTANPGFVGYIPGGGLYASALADFIACVINRYTGLSAPAPALVQIEASILRWLCDLFNLPDGSQGVLTPGGSMSNLSAIVAARANMLGENFLNGRMYVSDEVHHSITKSARIAGLPESAVCVIETDPSLRMNTDVLLSAIDRDRVRGLAPFMVVASAGTINTGVVDPLENIAALAEREGIWFHVDGAYGGFFQLTDRGRRRLRGIEKADSITLDPHKGLFLPYGTGCLLVKEARLLRNAHEVRANYLPASSEDPGLPDFSSLSPELTRDFRGLRLWLPLHLHGTDTFVEALNEKMDLARVVYEELSAIPDLDVPWAPELSLVAFRPHGPDEAAKALLDRINSSGRIWLSSATFRGHTYLRMCILSHRSHPERIHEGLQIIRAAVND